MGIERSRPNGRLLLRFTGFSAQRAAEFVGGRPTTTLDLPLIKRRDLSVVDRQRVPFLFAQERNKRRARGAVAPATPRRLQIGLRPKSAAPCHGSTGEHTASRQPPRRRRKASAREPPEPYQKCAREGTALQSTRRSHPAGAPAPAGPHSGTQAPDRSSEARGQRCYGTRSRSSPRSTA